MQWWFFIPAGWLAVYDELQKRLSASPRCHLLNLTEVTAIEPVTTNADCVPGTIVCFLSSLVHARPATPPGVERYAFYRTAVPANFEQAVKKMSRGLLGRMCDHRNNNLNINK